MIKEEDIVFVLSGGSGNTDPRQALGGEPSAHAVQAGLDNLFDDLTDEQSAAGRIDYRCVYVFNNNPQDTFFNTALWLDYVVAGSGVISAAIRKANETQQIVLKGTISGGSLDIGYEDHTVVWQWNSNLASWAINLQNGLNGTGLLTGVVVAVSTLGDTVTFHVTFTNQDGGRFQPLLTHGPIASLAGCTQATISKVQSGGPINSIAPTIDVPTTRPFGINFVQPTKAQPLVIGSLRALEGFPLWIERSVPAGSAAVADAGFIVLFRGSPL